MAHLFGIFSKFCPVRCLIVVFSRACKHCDHIFVKKKQIDLFCSGLLACILFVLVCLLFLLGSLEGCDM